jgi:hypothetical protein
MVSPILAVFFNSLFSFLGSSIIRILSSRKLQALAISAVEKASKMDLDNDGKWDHSSKELRESLKEIGKEMKDSEINLLLEAAVSSLKRKALKLSQSEGDES